MLLVCARAADCGKGAREPRQQLLVCKQRHATHTITTARFDAEQTFSQAQETQIKAVTLVDGTWYVRVRGDFAGRVSGAIYEVNGGDDERKLDVQASARTCTRAQAGQARHAYVL